MIERFFVVARQGKSLSNVMGKKLVDVCLVKVDVERRESC